MLVGEQGARRRRPAASPRRARIAPGRLQRQHLLQVATGGADERGRRIGRHCSRRPRDLRLRGRWSARLLRNRSRRATFLCYHSIADEGPRYLTVAPELFERQLRELAPARPPHRRPRRARGRRRRPQRPQPTVFLTFDDGFLDNSRDRAAAAARARLPRLRLRRCRRARRRRRLRLARGRRRPRALTRRRCGRSLARCSEEMAEGGFEVGSHTLTHPHLHRSSTASALRQELPDSRAAHRASGSAAATPSPTRSASGAARSPRRRAECGYRFAFTLPTAVGQRERDAATRSRAINVDYRDEERRLRRASSRPLGKELFLSPRAWPMARPARLRAGACAVAVIARRSQ